MVTYVKRSLDTDVKRNIELAPILNCHQSIIYKIFYLFFGSTNTAPRR